VSRRHHASPEFRTCDRELDAAVRELADSTFALLKADPPHSPRRLKRVSRFWSARVGLHHRAVGVEAADGILWFWIGTHAEYDRLVD
jgi:hypothetical protein